MSNLKEEFEKEVENIQQQEIFSPEYKRKKLIIWIVRTIITIILYYLLWDYTWVRWSLILYIPLAILSLFTIYGMEHIIQKKVERTRTRIDDLEDMMMED